MDPSYISEESEDEMAAAIGFSTFGKPPAAKKRKFNTTTDAFVEGDELEKIDKGGKKGKGSGGNEVPLGKTRVLGVRSKNEEEIGSDEDEGGVLIEGQGENGGEEEDEEAGPNYIDTSLPPPIESGTGEVDLREGGPAYVDRSLPLPVEAPPEEGKVSDEESREMQRRIDAILASIQKPPNGEEEPVIVAPSMSPAASIATMPRPARLPPKPAFVHGSPRGLGGVRGARQMGTSDTPSTASGGTRGRHAHGRNEDWYLSYYDASFNANPWERLEKELGLEPVGSWVRYPQ